MGAGREVLDRLSKLQSPDAYRQEHWQGSFHDYLDVVKENPRVTRSAFQRLYDMILSYGTYPVEGSKDGLIRYTFFDDPDGIRLEIMNFREGRRRRMERWDDDPSA